MLPSASRRRCALLSSAATACWASSGIRIPGKPRRPWRSTADLPIVVITPTASEVALTQRGYRNFFRVNAANDLQAQVGAEQLVNTLGAKKVAVLYNDDSYGIDLGKLVAGELQRLGAEVPLSVQVKVEQNRFADEVAKIKAAGVDAIYYAGLRGGMPLPARRSARCGVVQSDLHGLRRVFLGRDH